jgi:hypothetical protein
MYVGTERSCAADAQADFAPCDSDDGRSLASEALNGSQFARLSSITVIKMRNGREIGFGDGQRRCAATVLLNDGHEYPMTYRFYQDDDGDMMVYAEISE